MDLVCTWLRQKLSTTLFGSYPSLLQPTVGKPIDLAPSFAAICRHVDTMLSSICNQTTFTCKLGLYVQLHTVYISVSPNNLNKSLWPRWPIGRHGMKLFRHISSFTGQIWFQAVATKIPLNYDRPIIIMVSIYWCGLVFTFQVLISAF